MVQVMSLAFMIVSALALALQHVDGTSWSRILTLAFVTAFMFVLSYISLGLANDFHLAKVSCVSSQ